MRTVPETGAAGKSWKPNRLSCKAHGTATAAPGMPLAWPTMLCAARGQLLVVCGLLTGLDGTELI